METTKKTRNVVTKVLTVKLMRNGELFALVHSVEAAKVVAAAMNDSNNPDLMGCFTVEFSGAMQL